MAAQADQRPIEELTFKEASIELEQVVRALEGGDLELEDALARYARGVELLKTLRERLSQAEQKVQVLLGETAATTAPAAPASPAQIPVPDTTSAPSTAFINE